MNSSEGGVWFFGDFHDPWVVTIAESLPGSLAATRVDCAGDLPARPFDRARPPRLIILHRHRLTAADAQCLRSWREAAGPAGPWGLVLCVSPFVRYDELERWSGLANLVLSEAAAPDILARHVARLLDEPRTRPLRSSGIAFRIEVACGNPELAAALVEACTRAGHRAESIDERNLGCAPARPIASATPAERVLTIWEVPILEPHWAERLDRRVRATGPVIALCGFVDRTIAARAKASGACACLDLPCNLDDLLDVIDRVARAASAESWPLPAWIEAAHVLPPRPRLRGVRNEMPSPVPAPPPPWSSRKHGPTMH
jgi:hypothetical protein